MKAVHWGERETVTEVPGSVATWLLCHILQVGLLVPSYQSLLHWGGPTVLASATIQIQALLGLWQAGVRSDELSQALWREEEGSGCWW